MDVTLVHLDGRPVQMPTGFDAFGPPADPNWPGHPPAARQAALLLRQVMVASGFLINPSEWWHFSDKEWQRYPILDLPLTIRVPAP